MPPAGIRDHIIVREQEDVGMSTRPAVTQGGFLRTAEDLLGLPLEFHFCHQAENYILHHSFTSPLLLSSNVIHFTQPHSHLTS